MMKMERSNIYCHLQATITNNPMKKSTLTTTTTTTTTTTIIIRPCLASLALVLIFVVLLADSKTHVVKPTSGAATLILGQPLHFECGQSTVPVLGQPQFLWYKRELGQDESQKRLLQPNEDDTIEIHNERLTLTRANYNSTGDYICSALPEDIKEFAVIKVRAPPYIEEFGIKTSHTGRSATLFDGQRLELVCHVPDESAPVNITWLRSDTSDDERLMVPLPESETSSSSSPLSTISSRGKNNNNNIDNNNHLSASPNQATTNDITQTHAALIGSAANEHSPFYERTYSASPGGITIERINNFTKRLVIDRVGPENRGYYTCVADNGVTERSRKTIFIRVKDNIIALWPFLGILAELFILFTIIHIWETQKAYKESQQAIMNNQKSSTSTPSKSGSSNKRAPSGPTNAFETVPLNTN